MNRANVHVQVVGVNPPLHDGRREVDPFGCQRLNQRFRDDATAHVAALRGGVREIPRLADIDVKLATRPAGRIEKEDREEGSRRPAADHCNP